VSDAIFIVGYYRSGTSALSGALQRLGVKFFNEADPNEHNPLGFYEIPELIEFDVDLFNRLGVEWTDVRGLPTGWADRADLAPFLSRLDAILRRRFTAADPVAYPVANPVWGLKHPHLCRTLPLYERAALQAGHNPHVVHIFRDPWTAASSQQHKNGLTRAHALLLWMSYVTSGERQARHLSRSWLTYHDLLANPAGQLNRIEQDTGIALSHLVPNGMADGAAYLTSQLNRSEPSPQEDLARPLRDLVTRTWDAILARNFMPAVWDGFAEETADMVGFLTEIGASRGRVIPSFGGPVAAVANAPPSTIASLRPAERLDEGGEARLLALRAATPDLPRLAIIIAAPAGRAAAVTETLESLRGQWQLPASVKIIATEALAIPGYTTLTSPPAPGDLSRQLCAELNHAAATADYVAVLNAGDTLAADAILRFALTAATTPAGLIYCDEIVPRDGGPWVRQKPTPCLPWAVSMPPAPVPRNTTTSSASPKPARKCCGCPRRCSPAARKAAATASPPLISAPARRKPSPRISPAPASPPLCRTASTSACSTICAWRPTPAPRSSSWSTAPRSPPWTIGSPLCSAARHSAARSSSPARSSTRP
jgi:hypothetical protein